LGVKQTTDVATTTPVFSPLTVTQTSDVRDHIIRVGLNYKFYQSPPARRKQGLRETPGSLFIPSAVQISQRALKSFIACSRVAA
jgi:hypothetical protein